MIRIAIIEDEPKTRSLLRAILSQEFPDFEVVGDAHSVKSGLQLIEEQRPQAILLDVEMADGTGFDLLERLTKVRPHIIFVTAYDHYAVKALRSGAVDYIEKPFNPAELEAGLERVKQRISSSEAPKYTELLPSVNSDLQGKIAVPTRSGTMYLETQDIVYIKADSAYSEIHFEDGRKPLIISRTLKEIQSSLEKFGFIRPHRSYLINASKIKALNRTDGGNVVLTTDFCVPFSHQFKEQALKLIKSTTTFI